jgi:hypothetical protein
MAAVRIAVVSRQFADQIRSPGFHVGENTKGHHGRQVVAMVGGVAVHILEGISSGVGYRHQFDHTDGRVIGNTGAFVEIVPAQEILFDVCATPAIHSAMPFLLMISATRSALRNCVLTRRTASFLSVVWFDMAVSFVWLLR